jgi:competence protein ComEC
MNAWNQLPLLRILLPFIAGVLSALSLNSGQRIPDALLLPLAVIIAVLILCYRRIIRDYSQRWIFGLTLNIFIFLFAFELTSRNNVVNQSGDFCYYRSGKDTVIATVDEPVNERENTCRVLLNINSVKQDDKWITVSGKAMTYFAKDSLSRKLKYGDKLLIAAGFSDVEASKNPGEFDYRKFLALRSIYSRGFVKTGKWQLLSHDQGNIFTATALQIRERFLEIFRSYHICGQEYAVSAALLLGYTDKIDADLVRSYQGTGALHILSVSGMHVGVVFIVLNFLLAFMYRFKKGKFIKPFLLILMIWFYAAITGFSPAVCRAAAMISFVIFGKFFNRQTNIYNTLSASLLLLLLLNPLLIADVGFQLSYIAVIGIVALQKRIYVLWTPHQWLMNQLWLLISVSVAAQLATFPLALFYFNQFPNYFLFTNMIVVPLSNLIIYCGMLVLLISPFSFVAAWSAKLLALLVYLLNSSIRYIESMPGSVSKGIHITAFETLLIYLGMITIVTFLASRRRIYLGYALLAAIAFASSAAVKSYSVMHQKKMIVYDIRKSSSIDLISGKDHVLLCDSALIADTKMLDTHLKSNWDNMQLNDAIKLSGKRMMEKEISYQDDRIFFNRNFIQFYEKKIAIAGSSEKIVAGSPIVVDYLVITGNVKMKIKDLLMTYKPEMIIIDSSNSEYRSDKWMDECKELNIPCYSVLRSGAFEVSI